MTRTARATVLGALALLAGSGIQAAFAQDLAEDPRASFLELRRGVVGGIAAPVLQQLVVAGYDHNRRELRVVVTAVRPGTETDARPSYDVRTGSLGTEEFLALMDGVLERGLLSLPRLESPDAPDVYGRDATLRFQHAGRSWENRVAPGCRAIAASPPSDAEIVAFDEILEHVRAELVPRADRPGSVLDEHAVPGPMDPARLRAFLRAVELVREEPDAALLDLNRPRVSGGGPDWTVRFPWRWDQPLPADPSAGGARPAERACLVHVRDDGDDRIVAQAVPIDAQVDRERRAAFVLSHPSLPPPEHDLVLAGWIERGMSDDAVRAAWGPPAFWRGDVWIYERTRRPVTLRFAAGVLERID